MIRSVVKTTVKSNITAICDLANDFQTKFNFLTLLHAYFDRFQFVILREDNSPWLMISILLITCLFDRVLIL